MSNIILICGICCKGSSGFAYRFVIYIRYSLCTSLKQLCNPRIPVNTSVFSISFYLAAYDAELGINGSVSLSAHSAPYKISVRQSTGMRQHHTNQCIFFSGHKSALYWCLFINTGVRTRPEPLPKIASHCTAICSAVISSIFVSISTTLSDFPIGIKSTPSIGWEFHILFCLCHSLSFPSSSPSIELICQSLCDCCTGRSDQFKIDISEINGHTLQNLQCRRSRKGKHSMLTFHKAL